MGSTRSAHYDDARAETNTLIQIDDVLVEHADASIRYKSADRAGRVGAMDRVLTLAQGQRRSTHGVIPAATRYDIG